MQITKNTSEELDFGAEEAGKAPCTDRAGAQGFGGEVIVEHFTCGTMGAVS